MMRQVVGNHTGSVAALALVVIINWLIAHLATDWVMPPEVQSAVQTLISVTLTAWLLRRENKSGNDRASGGAVLGGTAGDDDHGGRVDPSPLKAGPRAV